MRCSPGCLNAFFSWMFRRLFLPRSGGTGDRVSVIMWPDHMTKFPRSCDLFWCTENWLCNEVMWPFLEGWWDAYVRISHGQDFWQVTGMFPRLDFLTDDRYVPTISFLTDIFPRLVFWWVFFPSIIFSHDFFSYFFFTFFSHFFYTFFSTFFCLFFPLFFHSFGCQP